MLADMLCELVVLMFLKVWIALYRNGVNGLVFEQVLNDRRVIKEAVDVGADTMVCLHDGLIGIAHALVNLVALTCLAFELEGDLSRGLLSRLAMVPSMPSGSLTISPNI